VHAQHNHARQWHFVPNILSRIRAVQARHRDIEEDHVGGVQGSQFHCFITVGALADDIEFAGSFQKRPQSTAYQRVIVNDQYANRSHVSSIAMSGTRRTSSDLSLKFR